MFIFYMCTYSFYFKGLNLNEDEMPWKDRILTLLENHPSDQNMWAKNSSTSLEMWKVVDEVVVLQISGEPQLALLSV